MHTGIYTNHHAHAGRAAMISSKFDELESAQQSVEHARFERCDAHTTTHSSTQNGNAQSSLHKKSEEPVLETLEDCVIKHSTSHELVKKRMPSWFAF